MGACMNSSSNDTSDGKLVTREQPTAGADAGAAVEKTDTTMTTVDDEAVETKTDEAGTAAEEKDDGGVDLSFYDSELRVHILQGRDLPSYDRNGKSDPYVTLHIDSDGERHSYKTSVVNKDLTPVWNDEIVYNAKGLFAKPVALTFDVYDYDRVSRNDYMGSVEMKDIFSVYGRSEIVGNELPEWRPLINRETGDLCGDIQIQIECNIDRRQITVRDWTHVMELTVLKGENIKSADLFGKSDPLCRVDCSSQSYKTKHVNNSDAPEWNERCFFFVDQPSATGLTDYRQVPLLRFTVMDDDLATSNDRIGTGILQIGDVFKAGGGPFDIVLHEGSLAKDKNVSSADLHRLSQTPPPSSLKDNSAGLIKVNITLLARAKVESDFYDVLITEFDANSDGLLSRIECETMFTAIQPRININSIDDMFKKYDTNGDDLLDKSEVMHMLTDFNFQQSQWAPLMILAYLKGDGEIDLSSAVLMNDVTKHASTRKRQVIDLKDRRTDLIVQEGIPGYVWQSLKLMYNNKTGRAMTHNFKAILDKMSRDKGRKYDSRDSRSEIKSFMKLHNLSLDECAVTNWKEFDTFNDFFAREMRMEYRPMHSPDDASVVVSPADCRTTVFENVVESRVWIKGADWSIGNLVGDAFQTIDNVDVETLEGGSFLISRLAPQDYHRWHYPVTGVVRSITHIDGALYTVNPLAINKPVNVYTENKRAIIIIDTDTDETHSNLGIVVMVAVSATLVGSYKLWQMKDTQTNTDIELQNDTTVNRGDLAGEFRFGGSTVLTLFQPNKVVFDGDLISNTRQQLETLVRVRDRIALKKE